MNPIEQIKAKLARHPELRFVETPSSIQVKAPSENGFNVTFDVEANSFTVHFDGWHEHFKTVEEALNCFAFAFSGQSRVAVTYRGTTAVRWTLETLREGQWLRDSETDLLFVPFWLPVRVVHRQNPTLIQPAA